MSSAPDSIIGPLRDKLPDVASSDDLDAAAWASADADPTDEFKLEIQVDDENARVNAVSEMQSIGISVGSDYGRVIKTRATAEDVFDIAEIDDVKKVFEELQTELHSTSEGVGVSNADTVQSEGITGSGVKVAILDLYREDNSGNVVAGFWDETHTKYGSNVANKLQSGPNQDTYFVQEDQLHGTGCTEIVYDMAPDADIVMVAYNGDDSDGDIVSMLKKIEQEEPDTAVLSVSLGSAPTDRLDGTDSISQAMDAFTTQGETVSDPSNVGSGADRGRVIAISAGNEADGNTWHGQYADAGGGVMEFEDGEGYLEVQNAYGGSFIIANWDSWDETTTEEYSVALYTDQSKTNPINSSSASNNWNAVQVPLANDGDTLYFEVTKESANRDHEFDVWIWGGDVSMEFTKDTTERSISIPATAQDSQTLTTAAIQATDFGVEPSAGDVKAYSSRGPTRDGRDGIEIAGPSRVSQTSEGYGTASSTADPGYGFNGTSAAAPHIAGAATQLFELSGVDHTDIANAIQNNGAGIPDSNYSKSDNIVVGGGYLDVQAAYDSLTASLGTKWTSNDLGGDAQYNTPVVDSSRVYVGGLQKAFYALSRNDGESVSWSVDRGNKPGLSDSSGYLWTDPTQNKMFFGSGQGDLYGVDADDATTYWSASDRPSLNSAITSSPTADGSTIIAGTNDGRVLAWDGSDSTAPQLWATAVDGAVYSDLIAASGLVYVTTENGTLHVLDTSNGNEQWKNSSFAAFGASSPALGNGRVYVAADEVHGFDAASSETSLWTSSGFGGTAGSNPVYDSGSVYVGSDDGNLYKLDAADGTEIWTYSAGNRIASTPAVNSAGDRIAFASMGGTLYVLDGTGTELQTISIPSDTRASPVFDSGELFLPTASGTVYAFE